MSSGSEVIDSLSLKELDASALGVSNGTNNVTISDVAPAGVGTATINRWIKIIINGESFYIPCWT